MLRSLVQSCMTVVLVKTAWIKRYQPNYLYSKHLEFVCIFRYHHDKPAVISMYTCSLNMNKRCKVYDDKSRDDTQRCAIRINKIAIINWILIPGLGITNFNLHVYRCICRILSVYTWQEQTTMAYFWLMGPTGTGLSKDWNAVHIEGRYEHI